MHAGLRMPSCAVWALSSASSAPEGGSLHGQVQYKDGGRYSAQSRLNGVSRAAARCAPAHARTAGLLC